MLLISVRWVPKCSPLTMDYLYRILRIKITYIDGDERYPAPSRLPHRSVSHRINYLEVCYILLNGEKPTQAQYD